MRIRAGYRLGLETFGPTPMNFLLSVRPERQRDLLTPEAFASIPSFRPDKNWTLLAMSSPESWRPAVVSRCRPTS